MPIVAIEGPDKCGKSTLFAALLELDWDYGYWGRPTFVSPVSFGKDRMHIAAELALRELEMWEALYRKDTLYICNRHVLTTDPVYSKLYNRPKLRESFLQPEVLVLYIDVDTRELQRRHEECGEEIQNPASYDLVKALYDTEVLAHYAWRKVLSSDTPEQVQELIDASIRKCN